MNKQGRSFYFFLVLLLLLSATSALSQQIVRVKVVDAQSKEPLPGASVVFTESKRGGSGEGGLLGGYRLLAFGRWQGE